MCAIASLTSRHRVSALTLSFTLSSASRTDEANMFSLAITAASKGSLLVPRATAARFTVAMFSTKMADATDDVGMEDAADVGMMMEQGEAKLRSVL